MEPMSQAKPESRQEISPQAAGRITTLLRKSKLKVTRSRIAMLNLLSERQTHMSADEIADAMHASGHPIDRVTVYRNIDRMLEANLLAMVYIPGRAMHVGLRSNPGSPHHHFIVCQETGRIAEIDSCFLGNCWEHARGVIKQANGWELTGHVMQYVGLCPEAIAAGNGTAPGTGHPDPGELRRAASAR
ncbi:MAG: transcriptional repressor [Candidatus Eisenbacteria sp.]|nr:transcriptional repressor [Candidatus Eisenbacteria bacterium]